MKEHEENIRLVENLNRQLELYMGNLPTQNRNAKYKIPARANRYTKSKSLSINSPYFQASLNTDKIDLIFIFIFLFSE